MDDQRVIAGSKAWQDRYQAIRGKIREYASLLAEVQHAQNQQQDPALSALWETLKKHEEFLTREKGRRESELRAMVFPPPYGGLP
jgi:hypothetical protein